MFNAFVEGTPIQIAKLSTNFLNGIGLTIQSFTSYDKHTLGPAALRFLSNSLPSRHAPNHSILSNKFMYAYTHGSLQWI